MKFHLAQVAYQFKNEWKEHNYYSDESREHDEFNYHLNILLNLLLIADPKHTEGKRIRDEEIKALKEEERRLKAEAKKKKKLEEEEDDAKDGLNE
jgi:glucose-6-phosphate 1-dehydrogenase